MSTATGPALDLWVIALEALSLVESSESGGCILASIFNTAASLRLPNWRQLPAQRPVEPAGKAPTAATPKPPEPSDADACEPGSSAAPGSAPGQASPSDPRQRSGAYGVDDESADDHGGPAPRAPAQSPPVVLSLLECMPLQQAITDTGVMHQQRPAKQARREARSAPEQRTAASAGAGAGGSACTDALAYCGGVVWCADFCPTLTPAAAEVAPTSTGGNAGGCHSSGRAAAAVLPATAVEWVALGVHAAAHSRNVSGSVLNGPGALQLWALPHGQPTPSHGAAAPRCMLCIAHQGGVTWDCKWCPAGSQLLQRATAGSATSGCLPLLGILAMVTGDGAVQVCSVPLPSALPAGMQRQADPEARDADDTPGEAQPAASAMPVLRIRPAVTITRQDMGGAVPSCCEWQVPAQGSGAAAETGAGLGAGALASASQKLLVGCWDGSVAMWALPLDRLGKLQLLFHVKCDFMSLRRVICPPADPNGGGNGGGQPGGGLMAHLFATVGQSGRVKVWDERDTSWPVLDKVLHRSTIHDATWTLRPSSLVCAHDDGALRQLHLDAEQLTANDADASMAFKEPLMGCLWASCYVPSLGLVLYGGEDGLMAALPLESTPDSRWRRPHVPLGGIVRDGEHLRLVDPEECIGLPFFYMGGAYYRPAEPTLGLATLTSRAGRGKAACGTTSVAALELGVGKAVWLKDPRQALHVVRAGMPAAPAKGVLGAQGSRRERQASGGGGGGEGSVWVLAGFNGGFARFMKLGVAQGGGER